MHNKLREIVKKPGIGKFRITDDVRGRNESVEPIAWPMSLLEVILETERQGEIHQTQLCQEFSEGRSCSTVQGDLLDHHRERRYPADPRQNGWQKTRRRREETLQNILGANIREILRIWIDMLLGYEVNDEDLLHLLDKV